MRSRPVVMGIVNATPDSFSDGGLYGDGVAHAASLIEAGADWIDVGGESTRPGAVPVDGEEEWRRVRPVIEAFSKDAIVSIDTSKPTVAARALRAGARIINDVTGLQNPDMIPVTADADATIVMHMRGTPSTMQSMTEYRDPVSEVLEWLTTQATLARSETVWIDPGIGFAKTAKQSLLLLAHISSFVDSPFPVLIGASRKSFIHHLTDAPNPSDRIGGSLAAVAQTYAAGAQAFRVHDVRETRQLLDLLYAIDSAAEGRP